MRQKYRQMCKMNVRNVRLTDIDNNLNNYKNAMTTSMDMNYLPKFSNRFFLNTNESTINKKF